MQNNAVLNNQKVILERKQIKIFRTSQKTGNIKHSSLIVIVKNLIIFSLLKFVFLYIIQ